MRRRNIVDDPERSVIIDAENKVAQVFPFVCVSAAKELEPTGGFVVIHAHKRYFGTPINGRTARAERNFTVFNGDGSCAGGAFAADNSTHIFRNIICAAKLKANTCRFSDGQLDIYKRKSEFTLLRTSRFSFGTPSAVIGMPFENACSSFERRLSAALPVWVWQSPP